MTDNVENPERKKGVGLLGGAALTGIAATPFLGMIGEDPITKDPYRNPNIKKYTGSQLERMARQGDIIVTTKNKWGTGPWKVPQVLATGTDFYHAEPVIGKYKGRMHSATAGQFEHPSWGSISNPSSMNVLRRETWPLTKSFRNEDFILLRPKAQMNKKEMDTFMKGIQHRLHTTYDTPTAVKSYLADLFLPKLKGKQSAKGECVTGGNVCSTMPSQAMSEATGKRVHPQKKPSRVLPADLLRSQSAYDVIGATDKFSPVLKNPRLARLLYRGGLGAGMAGAAYGMYEEPSAMAGIGAAVATPYLAQKLITSKYKKEHPRVSPDTVAKVKAQAAPSIQDVIRSIGHKEKLHANVRRQFLRRSIPLSLLAGLGTYGAGKGISKGIGLLRNAKNQEE